MFAAPSIEKLARLVESHEQLAPGTRSLVTVRPDGDRTPLFLIHGGAGTVLLYQPLAQALGPAQPVYAFQAVGLLGDHAPQASVRRMARTYVAEMRAVQPVGPYRIGGYCYGALVAFQMARMLARSGQQCELLIAFNGPSPSYIHHYRPRFNRDGAVTDERGRRVDRFRMTDHVRTAWHRRTSIAGLVKDIVAGPVWRGRRRVRRLRRDAGLLGAVVRRRPLPDALREADAFQRLSEMAQSRYRPAGRDRWPGALVVVRAAGLYHLEDLGWSDHVAGPITVVEVAGDQVKPRDTMTEAFVGRIAVALNDQFARLDR